MEALLTLDPRVPADSDSAERSFGTYVAAVNAGTGSSAGSGGGGSSVALFRNAFLCVVGGISVSEHLDLQAAAEGCVPPRVFVSGGTEVLHAESLLADLSAMGRAFL